MRKTYVISFLFLFLFLWIWAAKSYSTHEIELKFSHKLHVVDNEIECQTCHSQAENSLTGSDNLLPDMETCGDCHDIEDENNCKQCHSNPEEPQAVPRIEKYSKKFPHQKHLATGLTCDNCHGDIKELESTVAQILPTMTECIACHQEKTASTQCETCHLPNENLKPLSHSPNFIHTHSDLARNDATDISGNKKCSTCHQTNFCQDCHEGDNLDRRTHPLNYQFTHALQAQGKEKECSTCHTERSFCIDCHRDNQIMPHNHVAGWALPNVGGRHKDEAANDLESCMACHEQNAEQICQKCHGKVK